MIWRKEHQNLSSPLLGAFRKSSLKPIRLFVVQHQILEVFSRFDEKVRSTKTARFKTISMFLPKASPEGTPVAIFSKMKFRWMTDFLLTDSKHLPRHLPVSLSPLYCSLEQWYQLKERKPFCWWSMDQFAALRQSVLSAELHRDCCRSYQHVAVAFQLIQNFYAIMSLRNCWGNPITIRKEPEKWPE